MSKTTITARIDARRFNAMIAEMVAIDPTLEWDDVLTHEVAAANFAAQRLTKTAKVSKIRRDHKSREYVEHRGKKYNLKHRYPRALWRQLKAQDKRSFERKLAARGLARQSWLSAFGGLAVSPPGSIPAFVLNANYKKRQYHNSTIHRRGSGDQSSITLINSAPAVDWPAAKLRRALLKGINGRTQYFERNMATGYYRTLESRAEKYPGVYVRR